MNPKKITSNIVTVSLILFLTVATPCASADDDICSEANLKSAAKLMSLLHDRPADFRPACIDRAIHHLGELRAIEAIPILLRYLDYRREPMESEKQGVFLRGGDWYPAVSGLYQIGEPAITPLADVIRHETVGSPRFDLALETYMSIKRDDLVAGIESLAKLAGSATDPGERESLGKAALKASSKYCWPPVKEPLCQSAVA
jgi:hypothetical protein